MNVIRAFSGRFRTPGLSKLASLLDSSLLTRIRRGTGVGPTVRLKLFLAGWLFLVLLIPSIAFAQGETTSAIVGQVTDASGAAVPGATVTITSPTTGLQRSLKTDDGGRFNFPQLRPGTYSVKVEAEGFDQQQNDNVSSALGQKQEVDFALREAHSEQSVQVTTEAPLINTANATPRRFSLLDASELRFSFALRRLRRPVQALSPCQTDKSGSATVHVTIPDRNWPHVGSKSRACTLRALA